MSKKKPEDTRQVSFDFDAARPADSENSAAAVVAFKETIAVNTNSPSDVMLLLNRVGKGNWDETGVAFDGSGSVALSSIITNLNNPADVLRLVTATDNVDKTNETGKILYDIPQIFITNEAKPPKQGENSSESRFRPIPVLEEFDHAASLAATITNYTANVKRHMDGTSHVVLVNEIELIKTAGDLAQDPDLYEIKFEAIQGQRATTQIPTVKMPTPHDIAYAKLGLLIPKHD